MDHRSKRAAEEESLPENHMDYCFPGDEGGQKLTTLVVVERHSKMKKAVVVPSKGSTGGYAARMVIDLIEECGVKDQAIIVKSDQQPAIQFLVDDVCMSRTGAKTIVEQAPKGSKGSNGVVERAVQSTEQYLRTKKLALDERISFRIDAKHKILTWLCEYAGYLMNRLEVSVDGKTAYERCKSLWFGICREGALEVTDGREDGEDQLLVGFRLLHRCTSKEQRAYHRRSRDQIIFSW